MAIAYDNATRSIVSSYSHTITGTNPVLFVGLMADLTDTVTGITYNGVSMTQVSKQAGDGSTQRYNYLYMLMAPATGTNTVVISGSAVFVSTAVSYTGASQTTQADVTGQATNSSVTTISKTLTTVTDNSWTVAWMNNNAGVFSSFTGTSRGTVDSRALADSNAVVHPAGSSTLTGNWSPSGTGSICMATIVPFVSTNTSLGFFNLV
jgi:hypothetical protein